jgi:hypothetical protein
MSLVGAEQDLVDRWVEARLLAHVPLTDIVEDRIYGYFAPRTAAMPFVIYQSIDPPRAVRGVGTAKIMVSTLYVVKAVAAVATFNGLATVAAAINAAMDEPEGEATFGGNVFASVWEQQFSLVEQEGEVQYRHLGGEFLIQAQAA